MKKYLYIITGILFLYSCANLDVEPESTLTSSSMWETESDATGAMYGMYSQLRTALSSNYIYWGDYRTDLIGDGLSPSTAYQDMFNNTLDMEDSGTNWENLYTTINDCNLILKYVPDISYSDEDDRNLVLANAYFVRALCYYYCARVWGDAPIVLSGFESDNQEDLYPSRSSVEEVLAQVESDINMSVDLFPDDDISSMKIASKVAANMLKTDFYLWMAKTQDGGTEALNNAKSSIDDVLTSGLNLSDSYEDVFRDDENEEIIFSLDFTIDEYTGGFASDYLVPVQYVSNSDIIGNPVPTGYNQQWVWLTDDYISFLYEDENDSRAEVSFDTYYDDVYDFQFKWINKYLGEWTNDTRYFSSDIKVYRYAEAILFKAEIENELGNTSTALSYLNEIAERAYGVENYYSGNYSEEELDGIILNERLKEFSVEGKSWFDLIRFGVVFDRVESLVGRDNEENILYWPVNIESINTNGNITQTPGYD